jgi:hypothetical protein
MAVWANRPQVRDRIEDIFLLYLRDWRKVVHMNIPCQKGPVLSLETESANRTDLSEVAETLLPSPPIAFVGVHEHATSGPLGVLCRWKKFFR